MIRIFDIAFDIVAILGCLYILRYSNNTLEFIIFQLAFLYMTKALINDIKRKQ